MSKKILSVLTVVAIVATMFCFATISSSAWSGTITWEVPDEQWAKANKIAYCHYWNNVSGEGPSWQTAEEKMNYKQGDMTATFDIPEGDWNLVIISGDSGYQTYDTVMNASCAGDTIYATGETMENPVDSKKTAIVARWKNAGLGPHKVISSLGKVMGESYVDGEDAQVMFDTFVKNYGPGTEHPWEDDGALETGKSFEEIQKELRTELGLSDGGDNSSSGDNNSSSDDDSNGGTTTGGSNSTASNKSSSTSSKSSSTASANTTTTGDSTPYIFLAVVLVAALGVGVVAFTTRKKTN